MSQFFIVWKPNKGYEYETLMAVVLAFLSSIYRISASSYGIHIHTTSIENIIAIFTIISFFAISIIVKNYSIYKFVSYISYGYLIVKVLLIKRLLAYALNQELIIFLSSYIMLIISILSLTRLGSSYIKLAEQGSRKVNYRKN